MRGHRAARFQKEIEMNHPLSHAPRAMPPAFGITLLTLLRLSIASAWEERRRRAAERRDLQSLDEHALRDIGLSHRAAADWTQSPRDGPP
jgi:uncharacterized protein YjiS (DUF1127 family)